MKYFNSLPHTEVDDSRQQGTNSIVAFQLTTSHRGRRRKTGERETDGDYFNSLPHTEVDANHKAEVSGVTIFQLTTSHRGRQVHISDLYESEYISTHYLTQR